MAITRVILFTLDPEKDQSDLGPGVVSTLSFFEVPDGNPDDLSFTCMYCPPATGSGIRMAQPTLFLGTNAGAGQTYQTFRPDIRDDSAWPVVFEWITARLDPDARADSQQGRDSTTKEFSWLSIPYVVRDALYHLYWAKDVDPIRSSMVSWTEFVSTDTSDTGFSFEQSGSGLANWVHLRGVGYSSLGIREVLSSFVIRYRSAGKGEEGRDS